MASTNSDLDNVARWHFHPIANSRAHQEVVEQITYAVLSGAYHPGDRLPNIEELARLMGVSKPVVGEALKVLAEASVVRALRGVHGGVVVETNEVPGSVMAMAGPLCHLDLSEIVEARRPIELQIALKAAERATEAEFAAMQESIERLRAHRTSKLALRIRFDHQFHYLMGRAARSSALALYQHQILEHLFVRMRPYFSEIEDVDSVVDLHEDTLRAIRTGNTAKIARSIDLHLRPLEEAVLRRAKEK
jgi:GntR family transcriptional regulator, transcriptional repressor for pyruvate dehydrogenase complex